MTPLLFVLLLWALPHPPSEQAIGSVTLLEGSLTVIRGSTVYRGVEGMQLKHGDIVETSDGAFAQLEFASGIVIALGSASRVYILPAVGSSNGRPISLDLVMLNGWLKSETAASSGLLRFRTPRLAVTTSGGTFVARTSSSSSDVFVEGGGAAYVSEVNPNGDLGSSVQAKAGQFFSRQRGAVSSVARPSSAFLDAIPPPFRDTLPPRVARLPNKPAEAKAEHPATYEEIEPWLKMPATWRRGLAERFAPRLTDPSFRKQIENHVREFPEWAPILQPDTNSEAPRTRN